MTTYFDSGQGINRQTGGDPAAVMEAIASRYTGANPKLPHTFRVHPVHSVRMDQRGGYWFDLEERFADAPAGSIVCAWAKVWSGKESGVPLSVCCHGPMKICAEREDGIPFLAPAGDGS
jgi:unsaturated rhamnogalacturonyl hydrolase